MKLQRTLKAPVALEGATLWNKGYARLSMYPARTNTGLVIRRTDLKPAVSFPVSVWAACVERHRVVLLSTTYSSAAHSAERLEFAEHLLAALWGMGIDNVRVDVEGDELPFFDGSALDYIRAIRKAGILLQDVPRDELGISTSFFLASRGGIFFIRPASGLQISYVFYNRELKVLQARSFTDTEKVFAKDLAPARTFATGTYPGFDYPFDVRSSGNLHYPAPARFADEMLRHKVLDLLGDLALLGRRLKAHIWAVGTGHRETHEAVKLLTKEKKYGKLERGLDPLQAPPPISLHDD